ncbi:hypothetical protein [Nostoc sp. CHAB 5715]|uniref:hypothetical protein n=1 Tax=Nostoc sp. CHAB 5715 TaxID=2780400 RepID=UPI001E2ED267|nr:hypothetical protein [Nostoc sp. CHAB 5715]MCC5623356.1 hypothetical protein [Nostoc sp. CHAB 5715]
MPSDRGYDPGRGQPSIGRTKKKILRQIAVIVTATSFCISASVKPSQANPAILAPVAFCAGTAGVGCVFVGVAIIGGVTYYIWSNGTNTVASDASGSIFRTEYLDDPEDQENQEIVIALNAKSWQAAKRECAWHLYGQKFKVFQKKGRWYCTNKVD